MPAISMKAGDRIAPAMGSSGVICMILLKNHKITGDRVGDTVLLAVSPTLSPEISHQLEQHALRQIGDRPFMDIVESNRCWPEWNRLITLTRINRTALTPSWSTL